MILRVQNQLDQYVQNSYTSTTVATGGTTIPVKNINVFDTNYAVQIGRTGEAQSEILVVSGAVSGTAINTSGTLRFNHNEDVPVYNIHYDKIIFKRSTTGTAGTATAMTNGTVSITPDSQYTEFVDASGATTYAYKTQFYNSVSGDTSSDSDWFIPGGPSFYSLQKLRQRVKDRLYSAGYLKDDTVIDDWINEWLEEMNTAAVKVNRDYLMGTTTVAFGTSGLGTISAQDFMYPRKVEITYDGVTYYKTVKINVNEFADTDLFARTEPRHYFQGDTVIGFLPSGNQGTARILYSKGEAIMTDDADELPFPMRKYTRSFVNYGLHCAYENDQKDTLSELNYNKSQKVKNDFINEITPRDQTGPEFIEVVDSISGNDQWDVV